MGLVNGSGWALVRGTALGILALLVGWTLANTIAMAQYDTHAFATGRYCLGPIKICRENADCDDGIPSTTDVCDPTLTNFMECYVEYESRDDFLDTHTITQVYDVVDPFGVEGIGPLFVGTKMSPIIPGSCDFESCPMVGSLPVVAVAGNTNCVPGPLPPGGCQVFAGVDGAGAGVVTFRQDVFMLPEDSDADLLLGMSFVVSQDACDGIPSSGCPTSPNFDAGLTQTLVVEGCLTDPGDPGDGECCADNGSPGCDRLTCQELVCAQEPSCCTFDWNQACADLARGLGECGCDLDHGYHGVFAGKNCTGPSKVCRDGASCADGNECTDDVCDPVLPNNMSCYFEVVYDDDFGDTHTIRQVHDIVDADGAAGIGPYFVGKSTSPLIPGTCDFVSCPIVGSLPIMATSGNTDCVLGPLPPSGCAIFPPDGRVVFLQDLFVIPEEFAVEEASIVDRAVARVQDNCDGTPSAGCSWVDIQLSRYAQTLVVEGCENPPSEDGTPCADVDGLECTSAGCDGLGSCDQAHTAEGCGAVTVPDGTEGSTTPLLVARIGDDLLLNWDVGPTECRSTGYHLLWGWGEDVGSYTVSGSECSLDASGIHSWTSPPATTSDWAWYLIVGNDGSTIEGGWGTDSAGTQRSTGPSGECGTAGIELTPCVP